VRALLRPEELAALEQATGALDDEEAGATAKKLHKLARAGVAYHTAGLDGKQRRFVEQAFRNRQLKVICATPTLAAGVNTPARRVIIRDLMRYEAGQGNRPLPVMEIKQMMGRAGRPRYDPYGEAVLIVKNQEMKDAAVMEYLHGEPEPVTSKLAADSALRIHALASVAGGYASSTEELGAFFAHTFWAQEAEEWVLRERLDDVVWFLIDKGFLEEDGPRLRATLFGKRTSDLYIDHLSALRLRQALEHGTAEPQPFGMLHAVAGCPDVYPLYLRQNDDWVRAVYYERFGDLLVPDEELEDALSHTKTAMLLHDWIEETRMEEIEERFQVGPGDIRLRLDTAGWLVHALRELARAMRPDWQKPISDLGMRLESGVKAEVLGLLQLRGIGRVRARTLFAAGFRKPADLKGVPVARLA
jgi:helicase